MEVSAAVFPDEATNKEISWSIENLSGEAEIINSNIIRAISNGTVRLKASSKDGSGVYSSQIISIKGQLTGDALLRKDDLLIYPNPASDFLRIPGWTEVPATIRIYNSVGLLNKQEDILSVDQPVDIYHLKAGLYFIQIISKHQNTSSTFIKR